jgi:hypothetical protein
MSVDSDARIQTRNRVSTQVLSLFLYFIKRLTARIPMGQLHVEIHTRTVLRPALNWVHLTAIGLGGTIGKWDSR